MKLWIDDIRTPPAGYDWAKTSAEAITYLENNNPTHISFDHDLGGDDTSRKVVLWLCEHEDKWPSSASIHSMNPIGREWLAGMIQRYGQNCRLT
ncbi:MAG: hypothetical protein H9W81_12695 [Enterococcus sp.]|nr:hypothetical protein [Enterococcus sp.]